MSSWLVLSQPAEKIKKKGFGQCCKIICEILIVANILKTDWHLLLDLFSSVCRNRKTSLWGNVRGAQQRRLESEGKYELLLCLSWATGEMAKSEVTKRVFFALTGDWTSSISRQKVLVVLQPLLLLSKCPWAQRHRCVTRCHISKCLTSGTSDKYMLCHTDLYVHCTAQIV